MNTKSFVVIDNAFNRSNCADIIGLKFAIAPSYAFVERSNSAPDFRNYEAWKYRNVKQTLPQSVFE